MDKLNAFYILYQKAQLKYECNDECIINTYILYRYIKKYYSKEFNNLKISSVICYYNNNKEYEHNLVCPHLILTYKKDEKEYIIEPSVQFSNKGGRRYFTNIRVMIEEIGELWKMMPKKERNIKIRSFQSFKDYENGGLEEYMKKNLIANTLSDYYYQLDDEVRNIQEIISCSRL